MAEEVPTQAEEIASALVDLRRHVEWLRSTGQKLVLADRSAPKLAPAERKAESSPAARTEAATAPVPPPPVERKAESPPAPPAPAASAPPPPAGHPKPQATFALEPEKAPEPPAAWRTLEDVRAELGDCKRCKLCAGRNTIVFGVGNPRAELVFVGEGPGADEDAQGIPFVGKAGQLLTKMIEAMGFARDEVYICNVVKCRPPGNRNPEPDEIEACEPFLKAQLASIRPRAIVALGKFAAQTLLRDSTPITRLRGAWKTYEGIPLMPTFHPAYLLRSPNEKKHAWADLQQVMKMFGKEPAKRGGAAE